MKRSLLPALAVLLIASHSQPVTAEDSPDLAAYIESIRASGMSENAKSQVRHIAAILSGASILSYRPDPASGRYWPGYMSATCPNPNADEPELTQWKKMKTSDMDALVPKLKPFADADGSGFVTTEEGAAFRDELEFGYLAAQAARDEAPTIEAIARASGKDTAATESKLREYSTLAKRITDAGVTGLPEVNLAELKAAQD